MKKIYFLDTSYILALEIKNEYTHQKVLITKLGSSVDVMLNFKGKFGIYL